jgi:adenylate kinases
MRVILIGPPGAGKGTLAAAIKEKHPVAHISTGDMLRENVRMGTELGKTAKAFMDAGKLVTDDLILQMMEQRLSEQDALSGFLLDGFPRTIAQAEALDALMGRMSLRLDAVLLLEVSDEEVVRRLTSRRVCSSCGAIYNVLARPTKVAGVCDTCGGNVIQRDDDKEDVIRKRLAVYHEQTAPLVTYYERAGCLRRLDASLPTAEMMRRIDSAGAAGEA